MSAYALETKNLGKTVFDGEDSIDILAQVSLAVPAGQSMAICGPSGCGKSTLLGLLGGLDVPSTGEVLWFGEAISGLDEEARSAKRNGQLGFVFQSFQLLPQLSALENVMLPLALAGRSHEQARAEELLDMVGLAKRSRHFPATLSGGEQQRVALARAFALSPRLLLADEPTGSLDAASGERVMALFFELQREHQTTVVVVTHDQSLAGRCDQLVQMRAGRIV